MPFQKAEAIISGRVQGVGFRFFVERMANLLGVTGWVSNLPNGNVKVVAVGAPDKISDFLLTLREGPTLASVEDVKTSLETVEYNEYDSFEIMLGS